MTVNTGTTVVLCSFELKTVDIYVNSELVTISNGTDYFNVSPVYVHSHFASGTGTSSDPYLISNKRHLIDIGNTATSGKYYRLNQNIDLQSTAWIPLPTFYGTLDGNNKTLSNFKISASSSSDSSTQYVGFFTKNYGTIKNIIFATVGTQVSTANTIYFGVVAGSSGNGSSIYGCKVYGSCSLSIVATGANPIHVGSIVGYNQGGTIEKCYSNCAVTTSSGGACYVGGLIGSNISGYVYRCYSTGKVTVETTGNSVNIDVGGFVGRSAYSSSIAKIGRIMNCYVTGEVFVDCTGSSSYVYTGGFVGVLRETQVQYCYATGKVTGKNETGNATVGGFASAIHDCADGSYVNNVFASGDVYARGNYDGAETKYSYYGRFCAKESNNSFWEIYYYEDSKFKDGNTGKELTWDASWYTGKSLTELQTDSFLQSIGFSTTIWDFSGSGFPTLL